VDSDRGWEQDLGMVEHGASGVRRVHVEDARHNGQFLRVTWHGDRQQFVVSNWDGNACVGATRVPVAEVPALVGVLVTGLAEAAAHPQGATTSPRPLREHLRAWWRERTMTAAVLELRRVAPDARRRRSA
jgi:hypothetical protein